jgi:hypothetical protein
VTLWRQLRLVGLIWMKQGSFFFFSNKRVHTVGC